MSTRFSGAPPPVTSRFVATNERRTRLTRDSTVVASSPVLHLRFVIDSPASPAALGISADDRPLGIGMEALRIVGTADPTPRDPG